MGEFLSILSNKKTIAFNDGFLIKPLMNYTLETGCFQQLINHYFYSWSILYFK